MSSGAQDVGQAAFDVISIKPRTGPVPTTTAGRSPDRFANPDVTVLQLIGFAYQVQDDQILNAPSWVKSRRFDVSARADRPVAQDQMRVMMRRLLADRFGLRARTGKRELQTYSLVLARRDGPARLSG